MVILATLFPPACLLSVGSMQLLAKANHGWDIKGSKGLIFKPQAVPKVPMPRMCLVQYSLHGTLLQVGIRHTAGRTRTSMPKPSRCCLIGGPASCRCWDTGVLHFAAEGSRHTRRDDALPCNSYALAVLTSKHQNWMRGAPIQMHVLYCTGCHLASAYLSVQRDHPASRPSAASYSTVVYSR
ncbi:hypothetical protein F5Y01DRAFT_122094 [Xylaria sp. FL0043]|nr:hypothetical protein F5Y01DRAFT_122094 [Xylaria sp. FL0043]